MSTSEQDNTHLARGFYNCPETPEPVELAVKGQIPHWLSGVLYRTGPGTYSVPLDGNSGKTFEFRHWFDGLTLHHRFEIRDGKVSYRSKNGATAEEEYIKKTGILPKPVSFGQTDPCESILGRFFTKFKRTITSTPSPTGPTRSNIGVTITPHFTGYSTSTGQDSLISKTDANLFQVLDRVTLEPIEISTYKSVLKELDGILSAAHAGIEDGEFYNFVTTLGSKPSYKVFKIDSQGKGTVLAEITDAPAAYIHNMFVTKRYAVLVVWQADFKLGGLPILINESITANTFNAWSEKRKTLFYVIDRQKGGVLARYQTDAFFAFHCINSFDDDDGSVVLDIACYKDYSVLNLLTLPNLRELSSTGGACVLNAAAKRFRLENIPTTAQATTFVNAKVEFDLGSEDNIELPTVAPSVANRPYQFAYGIHTHTENPNDPAISLANSIIKLDVKTKTKTMWLDKDHVPGEPIFVPRPGATGEDAGLLLTVALDGRKGMGALVVIDAETMEEVGRAEMGVPFPFGFHGAFTASE